MKPRVFKSFRYGWCVDLYNYGDMPSGFPTWCEALNWAYAHATQHKEEER